MITKLVLGNDTVLEDVAEVQEIIQNNGAYILNGLVINITAGKVVDVDEIQSIFSESGALDNIKIYKKDIIEIIDDETTGEKKEVLGDEYLALDTSKYTGVQSVYKHIETDRVSVHLTADPTKIADDKYNELVQEKERLERALLELTVLLGGMW